MNKINNYGNIIKTLFETNIEGITDNQQIQRRKQVKEWFGVNVQVVTLTKLCENKSLNLQTYLGIVFLQFPMLSDHSLSQQ